MTKKELRAMRQSIEDFAEAIQSAEVKEKDEEAYNELWDMLDSAGGMISNILGDGL